MEGLALSAHHAHDVLAWACHRLRLQRLQLSGEGPLRGEGVLLEEEAGVCLAVLQDYAPSLAPCLRVDLADLGQQGGLAALSRIIPHSKLTDYINFFNLNPHFHACPHQSL